MATSDGRLRGSIVLGCIHLSLGLLILFTRYVIGFDIIAWLASEVGSLPQWSLFILGLTKGIYALGAYIPGTTMMLLYFLGHECSINQSSIWVMFGWSGVLLGLAASYSLGRSVSRTKVTDPPHWREFFFVVHPALAGMYFFELGYWQKPLFRTLTVFSILGLLLLSVFVVTICSSKELLTGLTSEIAPVWAAVLVTLGLWRIGRAIFIHTGR